jgi:biotin-dependent carboxylase-like uncharacterized protein
VIDPGLSTTVQDRGRPGFRGWGVPPAGAFDQASADLANALLGNDADAAILEMTLAGGRYEAEAPLALALAGAPMVGCVQGDDGESRKLSLPLAFSLAPGQHLVLGAAPHGVRTYLAVQGGWRTPVVLGSRSSETRLKAGDHLPCEPGETPVRHLVRQQEAAAGPVPIRVIVGPDFEAFAFDLAILGQPCRVLAESDRVGLRLDGPAWAMTAEPNRVSTPVAAGAIQAAGGRALVLGVACGTMGGYPHVLHVISADLGRIGQARPGDSLRFDLVSLEESRRLDREAREIHRRTCARIAAAAGDRGALAPAAAARH